MWAEIQGQKLSPIYLLPECLNASTIIPKQNPGLQESKHRIQKGVVSTCCLSRRFEYLVCTEYEYLIRTLRTRDKPHVTEVPKFFVTQRHASMSYSSTKPCRDSLLYILCEKFQRTEIGVGEASQFHVR